MNDSAHPIDLHVGLKMRLRRTSLGLSQKAMAAKLGVTFQQIQKYEQAHNRISASRLYEIAEFLETDISYFFPIGTKDGTSKKRNLEIMSNLETQGSYKLLSGFMKIANRDVRDRIVALVSSLARSSGTD